MIAYYLEAHIVVRAPLDLVKDLIYETGFWASTLTMDESEEEKAGDVIVTTRTDTDAIDVMKKKVLFMLGRFQRQDLDIRRYKIEAAILDSKKEDIYKYIRTPE